MRTLAIRPAGEPGPFVVCTAKTLRSGSTAVSNRRDCCHSLFAPELEPSSRPLTQSRNESSAVIRISAPVAVVPAGVVRVVRNARSSAGGGLVDSGVQIQDAPSSVSALPSSGVRALPIHALPAQSSSSWRPVRNVELARAEPASVLTWTSQA